MRKESPGCLESPANGQTVASSACPLSRVNYSSIRATYRNPRPRHRRRSPVRPEFGEVVPVGDGRGPVSVPLVTTGHAISLAARYPARAGGWETGTRVDVFPVASGPRWYARKRRPRPRGGRRPVMATEARRPAGTA